MLDKRMESMLQVASTLTAEDLDGLRALAATMPASAAMPEANAVAVADESAAEAVPADTRSAAESTQSVPALDPSRGERERQRTRESKISTTCVGREREKHDWWPVGIELIGRIGGETFTARVVENTQVKSNRSILITSGAASGKVCLTPTRAAIEATETYRQARNYGRVGGVTNGWQFWQPRT